jgi:hypothetical protein
VHCIERRLEKSDALEMMERLSAANVEASLRYEPDGRGETTNEYAIFVAEEDAERAADALGIEDFDPEHEGRMHARRDSIVSCPRCQQRKISFPEDRWMLIAFLSAPLIGVPAMIYFAYSRVKGSRKRCESCHHEWRSKP